MLILPTTRIPAESVNPGFLIFFGKPKSGKTTIAAALENNLIIDLEGGSTFLDAMAVQARSIQDLSEIRNAVKAKNDEAKGFFYKYITIDNVTRLEDICLPYAATLYRQQPLGKNWTGDDVRTLPKGAGYLYLRKAVLKVIDMFKELCEKFILIGHTKDAAIKNEGEEQSEYSLNLVGALADIVCGLADAVGYVYRKNNETVISFEGGNNQVREARAAHLRGKRIVIATSDDNNNVTVHWERIFLPE